ncbi:trifunctional transcriptional regulator/proline dehydrogenase/L-glutamate gamma-semialdehyde dehydrogenase [Aureimonas fodinaquatilis]|uniref:Bifunctional protein PutA n=1 Tax=Aureimonas fodinaquatilis TaxID=2565783 RepID=A0A5B0DVU9_9HYPH|nr:trifunctional transcriptional regulator/proline dehydrogenase/L-glutamate gamma-semialdehyde dehydrogenase [Aureimonas fodinaquatilis]KAA0970616.1 trifunctional transcriptional regulator/proline dehydrogenase/L-glutamate gamma-semialdehyde dehydrogenase [Aureimonas fodinaquatilis]
MKFDSGTVQQANRAFADFATPVAAQTPMRQAITAATRLPEAEAVAPLLRAAAQPPALAHAIAEMTEALVNRLRAKATRGGVPGLIHEYSLSSQEGIALMCLAEALLRIPDTATRDALIRDKIAKGNWRSHIDGDNSLFVNAATWGLLVTGRLTATVSEAGLSRALSRLVSRFGEPVIRQGLDIAMRLMGEQFVRGETIDEALKKSRSVERKGFRYSYDMLGEAAVTAEDAARYYKEYEAAIHSIGKAAAGKGVLEGPGISIKLSALHPRYVRAKAERVMDELYPRVFALAALCRTYKIGLNIDAEEADRLEISLDLLEKLAFEPELADWDGIGFVVQAYGKRCPRVIDWLIDLGNRSHHRLMVRLVKGAYWDAEIKRAQVEGYSDFPVYTRKVHTDVAYLACARQLLAAPEAVFPQFASHNAQTLASIYAMADPAIYWPGQYEFQCLHGMGEPLYEEVVGADALDRPCRIYAPVGTHETLLAYLVRRLLENGANSSFVNRIADEDVSVSELAIDPVQAANAIEPLGSPNPLIAAPRALFAESRVNSAGYDLANEAVLAQLSLEMQASASHEWLAEGPEGTGVAGFEPVLNPADHRDVVGKVRNTDVGRIAAMVQTAEKALGNWAERSAQERADLLDRASDLFETNSGTLLGLIIREAGKSLPNAVAEVREAVDFLRYYAAEIRASYPNASCRPLGPVACISPWNFPLAIFTGQLSAALAAGNTVLAKPAEETPLVAAEAVRLLHSAGIPSDVLQLVPGAGDVGATLVGQPQISGVLFTGSTEVARLIEAELAGRRTQSGQIVPLVAETGGQNAMIVDSSALTEQVVADVISSAFDSAGQRCSALRILCVQEEAADRTLSMLRGALNELAVGPTDRLSADIGPVISSEAQANIVRHIETMRGAGFKVTQPALSDAAAHGTFVPPTIVEIDDIGALKREVFGPVLHVLRYRREALAHVIEAINATGYGLTFGLHTRIDETIDAVTSRVHAGNVYVNRNVIGAVVGVQPFGGRGLSGTGPKAGGPLYLKRLLAARPAATGTGELTLALRQFADWLVQIGQAEDADKVREQAEQSLLGLQLELPGPVGEKNLYEVMPRGLVMLCAKTPGGLALQMGAALATGNGMAISARDYDRFELERLPADLRPEILRDGAIPARVNAVLAEGEGEFISTLQRRLADKDGGIAMMQALSVQALADGAFYQLEWLVEEKATSINTAAAGGNASLMAIA